MLNPTVGDTLQFPSDYPLTSVERSQLTEFFPAIQNAFSYTEAAMKNDNFCELLDAALQTGVYPDLPGFCQHGWEKHGNDFTNSVKDILDNIDTGKIKTNKRPFVFVIQDTEFINNRLIIRGPQKNETVLLPYPYYIYNMWLLNKNKRRCINFEPIVPLDFPDETLLVATLFGGLKMAEYYDIDTSMVVSRNRFGCVTLQSVYEEFKDIFTNDFKFNPRDYICMLSTLVKRGVLPDDYNEPIISFESKSTSVAIIQGFNEFYIPQILKENPEYAGTPVFDAFAQASSEYFVPKLITAYKEHTPDFTIPREWHQREKISGIYDHYYSDTEEKQVN